MQNKQHMWNKLIDFFFFCISFFFIVIPNYLLSEHFEI